MAKATAKAESIKVKKQGEKVVKEMKEAVSSPLMETLTRLGYAVKGFLYVAIGFIAVSSALGKSSTPADQLGAIVEFSKFPFAQVLLWVILIGLISYSLWGVVRAVLDPFHKGKDLKGLMARGGYLVSAATYASFIVPTYQLIQGVRKGTGANATVEMVSKLMNMPLGPWLVAGLGVATVVAGFYQMYMGFKKDFDKQFDPYALSADQRKLAIEIGRFGTIARGIVFAVAGFFLVLAGYQANPGRARGFDGALDFLAQQPYGVWLLGIIALGLIALGLYAFMSAAWLKLKR